MDIANELYNNDIIDTNQFDEMYDIYESSENYDNNRGKSVTVQMEHDKN